MNNLLAEVIESASSEYYRAANKFGEVNNSPHESYAVILEEFEEAQFESERFRYFFDWYWREVKHNSSEEDQIETLEKMRNKALHAAAEWIQVAAMCYKATVPKEAHS